MKNKIIKKTLLLLSLFFFGSFFSGCSTNQMVAKMYGIETGYSKYNPEITTKSDYNNYLETIIKPNNNQTLSDEKGSYFFKSLNNGTFIGSMTITKGAENYLEVLKSGKALLEPIYTYNSKGDIVMDRNATKSLYYKLKKVLPNLLSLKYTYKYDKVFQSYAKKTKLNLEKEIEIMAKEQVNKASLFVDVSKYVKIMQAKVYNKGYYENVIKKLNINVDYLLLNNEFLVQELVQPNNLLYTDIARKEMSKKKKTFSSEAEKKSWNLSQESFYNSKIEAEINTYEMKKNKLNLISAQMNILPTEIFKNLNETGYNLQKIWIQTTNTKNKINSFDSANSNSIMSKLINRRKDNSSILLQKLKSVKKDFRITSNKINKKKANMFNDKLVGTFTGALKGFKITTGLTDDSL